MGRATPFVGRLFMSGILGSALALFMARRFAHTSTSEVFRPAGSDSVCLFGLRLIDCDGRIYLTAVHDAQEGGSQHTEP